MTEPLEQENDATETEAPVEEPSTGSNQTKKQTFTFDEHTAEVKRIVAKEKASWKKANERLTSDHETIVASLQADLQKRDEVIQSNVDLLRKDLEIPDEDWEFISDGKDALAQYEFLLKKMEKANKDDAKFPRTPKGDKHQKKFQTTFRPNV